MEVKQKYNQDTDGLSQLEIWCQRSENQLQTEGLGPQCPTVSSPARMRKKCCCGQKNLGSICSSLSPSPTYLSHNNKHHPFENKVWEVYFYKEVCSFVHWSSSVCFVMYLLTSACIWVYNNHTRREKGEKNTITQNFNSGRLVSTKKKQTPSACYRCGKVHWAKNCPYRAKNIKTAINSDIRTHSVETEK